MLARTLLGLALLAGTAARAAPEGELLREEAFNYRVVGLLPDGWKRRPDTLVFAYAIDDIPHAYVHLVRARLKGDVDAAVELKKREPHYRFPKAPKDAKATFGKVQWGGLSAAHHEHEATVQGVLSRRRVTVLCVNSVWYELVETVYGAKTEDEHNCAAGLRLFRKGFQLLTTPLTEAEKTVTERTLQSRQFGFTIVKPAGFRRAEVDPAADPGVRVAFEAQAADPRKRVRVRLFEYGKRAEIDATKWFEVFFNSFSFINQQARRAETEAPKIAGAQRTFAEVFTGKRDKLEIRTQIVVMQAGNGRVFALRIRTQAGADADFATAIAAILRGTTLAK